MALTLPRLFTTLQIVDANGNTSAQFVSFWNSAMTNLENAVIALQSQITQNQAAQAAAAAAQIQANNALTVADNGGSAGAQSGSTTVNNLTIGTVWLKGPQVDLTSVLAGNLSFTVTFNGAQPSGTPNGDTGSYRIQQIVGASETTVFTGSLTVTAGLSGLSGGWTLYIADMSTVNWSGVNFPESSTGAISYRLDFILNNITYLVSYATLFARRF